MIAWSPTPRRNAVSGAIKLISRPEWRASSYGPQLEQSVRSALSSDDHVARFHAARAIALLEPEPPDALRLIRRLLLVEPDPHVAAVLVNELGVLAENFADEVDALIREIIESPQWRARLQSTDRDDLDSIDPLITLVLWLALRRETPAATAIATSWFVNPIASPVTQRAIQLLRRWLELPMTRSAERERAFGHLAVAAQRINSLRAITPPADAADIYRVADTIADQLYYASGAFGTRDNDRQPVPPQEGFAPNAFDVIEYLVEFKHPAIVHHLVETLGHLSPLEARRAFLLIERAIRSGDEYTYDSMAADRVIALIVRYLAEYRDIVASDAEVLGAVHRVLSAFVRVGWPAAISLSYNLGEAFR